MLVFDLPAQIEDPYLGSEPTILRKKIEDLREADTSIAGSCDARTPRFMVSSHHPRAAPRRRGGRSHLARRGDRTPRSTGCCRSRGARTAWPTLHVPNSA